MNAFLARLEAQRIINRACQRAMQECERAHEETGRHMFTLRIVRWYRAVKEFNQYNQAFKRLNRAFLYLARQNAIATEKYFGL